MTAPPPTPPPHGRVNNVTVAFFYSPKTRNSGQIRSWLVNELTSGQEADFSVVLFVFLHDYFEAALLCNEADAPRAE